MINRKIAPPIKDATDFNLHLLPYEHFTLDNGVDVFAVNTGNEEVIKAEWVFYAGNWYEDQNLVAATTNFLLKNGTNRKSAFEINEHFEYYGAFLNRSCYSETASVSLHMLNKHMEVLLPVVQEILTESVIPEDELGIYKKNNKQRLELNLKKSEFVANRLIDAYLFGPEHPYGKFSTAEGFDALEREQLIAFYDRYYRKGKCILFISGKLPKNYQKTLNGYFGQLPLGKESVFEKEHIEKPADEKKYRVRNISEGVQGAIRMGSLFPTIQHPDHIKMQVLNTVFGGFFGSRLMSNIREDKGYTYGIHSILRSYLHQGALLISTEAGVEVCEATLSEIYKEMKRLREEPVSSEELSVVKNFMIGAVLGDLDGPFQIMARWKKLILHGLEAGFFTRSVDTIKDITAEELQILANKYLVPENFYELVVI